MITEKILNEIKKLEPCEAEAILDSSEEIKVVFEGSDFSLASSATTSVLGLRAIAQQRLGFVTSNSFGTEDLRALAHEVQQVCRLSQPSEFHSIATDSGGAKKFELWDTHLALAEPKDVVEWAKFFIDEVRKDSKVAIDRAEVTLTLSERRIQNTAGVDRSMRQTSCSWYAMGMGKDGDEVTSFDYEADCVSHLSEVQPRMKSMATLLRESLVGSLGAKAAPRSYNGLVLLHPAAVESLIAGLVEFNVSGRAQQDGMSQWKNSQNQKVISDLLTFIDDPLDTSRASVWNPFDREGVLTQKTTVIDHGVLRLTAHNGFTAKRGGVKSTGHATGGARSLPGIGLHGLKVQAGTTSEAELLKQLGSGLVLKRFSGNEDPVSGQFSGVAKNSWWVEGGKRTHALNEVMISGNLFELAQQIKAVGDRIHRQMGSFEAPYILVDGLSVTSG